MCTFGGRSFKNISSTPQHIEKRFNRTHRVLAVEIPRSISFKALDNAIRTPDPIPLEVLQGVVVV